MRFINLDYARALAILLVVISHIFYEFPNTFPKYKSLSDIMGIIGVEIFFCLSGFLIGNHLHSKNLTIKNTFFYIARRIVRITPLYYLFILIYFYIASIPLSKGETYFVYLHAFITIRPSIFPPSWSLCIEAWAYILMPISAFLLYSLIGRYGKLLSYLLIFAIASILREFDLILSNAWWINDVYVKRLVTAFRFDALSLGLIASWVYLNKETIPLSVKNFIFKSPHVLNLTMFISSLYLLEINLSLSILLMHTSILLILYRSLNFNFNTSLTSLILWISKISYSMYLCHDLVQKKTFEALSEYSPFISISVYFILLFLASSFIYYFIESKFTKYGYSLVNYFQKKFE